MEENKALTEAEKIKIVNDWWTENYTQLEINIHKVLGYSLAAISKWKNDLMPYAFESFRKMDLDKQVDIIQNGNPENYITRGFALSIKSSTSMFYSTYRKFNHVTDEFSVRYHDKEWEEEWELREKQIAKVKEAIKDLHFYDKFLIEEYYINEKTAIEIAKQTGIAASTVGNNLKKALKRMKVLLEDKYKIEF